jgi:hypothetical protein
VFFHSKALHTSGQDRNLFLQRALDHYNAAQQVLYHSWSDIADDCILLVLSLALSNQVGHVHYWLNNIRESVHSLHALQHFLCSLPEDCHDDDEEEEAWAPGGLSREDYNFFNKSVVIFEGAHFDVAPSA